MLVKVFRVLLGQVDQQRNRKFFDANETFEQSPLVVRESDAI